MCGCTCHYFNINYVIKLGLYLPGTKHEAEKVTAQLPFPLFSAVWLHFAVLSTRLAWFPLFVIEAVSDNAGRVTFPACWTDSSSVTRMYWDTVPAGDGDGFRRLSVDEMDSNTAALRWM